MEKLLQWSIAQTTGDEEAKKRVGDLDPELVAQLFGKMQDDPALMKQNLYIIDNADLTLEDKIIACENFEMLIENLDNAMNLENMKMWETLIKQLYNKELTKYIASIIGTLLQNNDKSQQDFLQYNDGMLKLIEIAKSESTDLQTKLKSIYALSCLLRHNLTLSNKFNENSENYEIITKLLSTEDDKLILRALSLLSAVLSSGLTSDKIVILQENGIIQQLINLLKDENNINIRDKIMNILAHDLISNGFKFTDEEKISLKSTFDKLDTSQLNKDDYDIIKQVLI